MIKILVGDNTEDLYISAKKIDSNAKRITKKSSPRINGVYYITLADFPNDTKKFIDILEKADEIIYSPPPIWHDFNGIDSKLQQLTELYLITLKSFKYLNILNVDNIKLPQINKFLELSDARCTNEQQLWIAGCSISHGDGVDKNQRYGTLLSKKLNLPVSFLTTPGSSIQWAADQILRSDLQANDMLIWGLTSFERYAFYYGLFDIDFFKSPMSRYNEILPINILTYENNAKIQNLIPKQTFLYQNAIYHAITNIFQVINHCKKIGVKLYLVGILSDLRQYTIDIENYISLYNIHSPVLLDKGQDNMHPGPLTHQMYADKILELIQKE